MALTHVSIDSADVKEILNLDKARPHFKWYEVFGYKSPPPKAEVLKKFRALSLKYHPDKPKKDDSERALHGEVMRALTSAKSLMDK